eukprot:scaffold5547_cov148-Isochrysis_galbana.AAC.1
MTGKHNAYLGANKYTGIDLNRFMVRQLPVSLLQTREAILREMITNPSFGNDYSQVLERCCEVLEAVPTHGPLQPQLCNHGCGRLLRDGIWNFRRNFRVHLRTCSGRREETAAAASGPYGAEG